MTIWTRTVVIKIRIGDAFLTGSAKCGEVVDEKK